MKKAIVMRCNGKQFKAVKPKLKGKVRFSNLTPFHSEYKFYLINNLCDEDNLVTNVTCPNKQVGVEFHEEWNEKVFLEACGVETELELIIGKWYDVTNISDGSLGFCGLGMYTLENNCSGLLSSSKGFNFKQANGKIWRTNGKIKEAEESKVFDALKNEAVKRGFVNGAKITCPIYVSDNYTGIVNGDIYWADGSDCLSVSCKDTNRPNPNFPLFWKGQWSKIIEQPKEKSKVPTLQEVLNHFENAVLVNSQHTLSDFRFDPKRLKFSNNENKWLVWDGGINFTLWSEDYGFAKIVTEKTKEQKPQRPKRLEELEKHVEVLESEVKRSTAEWKPIAQPFNFGIDFGKPDSHNDILTPGAIDTSWLDSLPKYKPSNFHESWVRKLEKSFNAIDPNPHSELNRLKLRIEELEAENKFIKSRNQLLNDTISELSNANQIDKIIKNLSK